MHVLLLTHYFPPGLEVGGVRPERLVRALRERGHRITVVTAALPGEQPGLRQAGDGLVVRTVPALTPVRLLLARLKFWASPGPTGEMFAAHRSPGVGLLPETLRARLRRWVLAMLWTPDDRHRFILPAVRMAGTVHAADPVDIVYSTAPPFSVHLAAALSTIEIRRPWVAEFRDPWTDIPRDQSRRSAMSDRLEARLERMVLRRAARVVAVTPTVGRWLENKRRAMGLSGGVVVAWNGLEGGTPPVPEEPAGGGPIDILHAGTLYLHRDPRPLLRAVASAIRKRAFGGRPIHVSFLGAHGEHFEGVSVLDVARDLGIEDVVRFEGHLPPEACRARMARATALLLLAQDQPAQVPNKLFDYLGVRRPVIALTDPDGESARLLERVGGHHVIGPRDPAGLEAAVTAAVLAATRTPSQTWEDNPVLASLAAPAQFGRVVDLLETLHGQRGPGRDA